MAVNLSTFTLFILSYTFSASLYLLYIGNETNTLSTLSYSILLSGVQSWQKTLLLYTCFSTTSTHWLKQHKTVQYITLTRKGNVQYRGKQNRPKCGKKSLKSHMASFSCPIISRRSPSALNSIDFSPSLSPTPSCPWACLSTHNWLWNGTRKETSSVSK